MLITSPRKLSVLENFRALHLRPASLSRHPPARSTKIAQEPQLKLVKILNPSQNAVFNPILRLFLPQKTGEPGINFSILKISAKIA